MVTKTREVNCALLREVVAVPTTLSSWLVDRGHAASTAG